MPEPEDTADDEIKNLLSAIEREKSAIKPNKRQMRKWFYDIVRLKKDFRETRTGQDDKFLVHTSMKTWRDDC